MEPNTVLDAIADLEAAGEPITCRAVHQRTRGSMREVAAYVRQWRAYELLPETDWQRLEGRVEDFSARLAAHPGDVRLHGYLKELAGLLLQAVRTMHNESLRPPPRPVAVRYATRKERSAQNKAQWAEHKALRRWPRMGRR